MKLFIDEQEYCDAAILGCGEVLLERPELLATAVGAALDIQLTKALSAGACAKDRAAPRYEVRRQDLRLAVSPTTKEPDALIFKVRLDEVLTVAV
jgi:hypothetical protein